MESSFTLVDLRTTTMTVRMGRRNRLHNFNWTKLEIEPIADAENADK